MAYTVIPAEPELFLLAGKAPSFSEDGKPDHRKWRIVGWAIEQLDGGKAAVHPITCWGVVTFNSDIIMMRGVVKGDQEVVSPDSAQCWQTEASWLSDYKLRFDNACRNRR